MRFSIFKLSAQAIVMETNPGTIDCAVEESLLHVTIFGSFDYNVYAEIAEYYKDKDVDRISFDLEMATTIGPTGFAMLLEALEDFGFGRVSIINVNATVSSSLEKANFQRIMEISGQQ